MKLTDEQVAEIRFRYGRGETVANLGQLFGVTSDHVQGIVHWQTRTKRRLTREEIRAKDKARFDAWILANPERRRASSLRAAQKYGKVDRQRNPDKWAAIDRQHAHKRRAGYRGGVVTPSEWIVRLEEFGRACAYCLRTDRALTQDHVTALADGGPHHIDNIVPACLSCNCSKQARGPLAMLNRKAA